MFGCAPFEIPWALRGVCAKMSQTTTKLKTEKVAVIPDPSLMLKISRAGYSLPEMLAEFGDNSIDAALDGKVTIEIAVDEKRVIIEDDARGMDKGELIRALTIASSVKKDALGEYGIGMKAAAVALGNAFVIETKKKGSDVGYRVAWDVRSWVERGEWSYDIETRKAPKANHGTVLTISHLKFSPGRRVGLLKNELGRRFGPFISGGALVLKVNGARCKAPEPELLDQKGLGVKNPTQFDLKTQGGETIKGWVGLLANSSQKGLYGFDTFRRGRLITFHDKFGFQPHPTTARIVGGIHMDHVPVTTNKREWEKTSPLYEDAEATLKEFLGPFIAECRRLAVGGQALRPADSARLQKFKEGLAEAMMGQAMKDLHIGTPGGKGRGPLGEVPIEERGERSDKGEEHGQAAESHEPQGQTRTPQATDPTRLKTMRLGGRVFDYQHSFGSLGEAGPRSQYDWDSKVRRLTVISNTDAPLMRATKDPSCLAFQHVCYSIAQVAMLESEAGFEVFDNVLQVLEREAAKRVADL